MKSVFGILILAFSIGANAYIPSSKMILNRVVENSLKLPLYVEQDISLNSGGLSIVLKEKWLFESENSIRLIVSGEKDLKDQIAFQIFYTDGQKTSTLNGSHQVIKGKNNILEKVFFIKNSENLMRFLIQQGIVSEEIFSSQNFQKVTTAKTTGTKNSSQKNAPLKNQTISGFQYQPEPFLRLGRIGGGIAYIFGPAVNGSNLPAGFWVEQDQFNILKIRKSSGEEMRSDKPSTFSRGARWPKEISYSWLDSQVQRQAQVQIINVKNLETPLKQSVLGSAVDRRTPEFGHNAAKNLVEEFYLRFR